MSVSGFVGYGETPRGPRALTSVGPDIYQRCGISAITKELEKFQVEGLHAVLEALG